MGLLVALLTVFLGISAAGHIPEYMLANMHRRATIEILRYINLHFVSIGALQLVLICPTSQGAPAERSEDRVPPLTLPPKTEPLQS